MSLIARAAAHLASRAAQDRYSDTRTPAAEAAMDAARAAADATGPEPTLYQCEQVVGVADGRTRREMLAAVAAGEGVRLTAAEKAAEARRLANVERQRVREREAWFSHGDDGDRGGVALPSGDPTPWTR